MITGIASLLCHIGSRGRVNLPRPGGCRQNGIDEARVSVGTRRLGTRATTMNGGGGDAEDRSGVSSASASARGHHQHLHMCSFTLFRNTHTNTTPSSLSKPKHSGNLARAHNALIRCLSHWQILGQRGKALVRVGEETGDALTRSTDSCATADPKS